MIHEFHPRFFELPLENYILTFDDGLYSQYLALDQLKSLKTPKIFFISSGIISGVNDNQSEDIIRCSDAHKKAFHGNHENYMNLSQILEIQETNGCYIGGHSHSHSDISAMGGLSEIYQYISDDTTSMVAWAEKYGVEFGGRFCFPYNNDWNKFYSGVVKKYGFGELYGQGRVDVMSL